MTTFIWKDTLTVSVGEMTRTAGLEVCQQFDALAALYTDINALLTETDMLCVLHAPTTVKVGGAVMTAGTRVIPLDDGETVTLSLPLTREGFMTLPYTLTAAWISAAVRSNEWLVDVLKKVFAPTSETGSAPKSASAPLREPNPTTSPTETIG